MSQKKRGYAKSEQEKRRIVWGGRCFCRLDITPPVYCNTKFFIVAVLTLKTMTGYFESTYGQSPDHVPQHISIAFIVKHGKPGHMQTCCMFL